MTISSYIEQDLEARIRSGERPPKLTIGALAQHYGVSFSPVRAAVNQLVARCVLVREANGRLTFGERRSTRRQRVAILIDVQNPLRRRLDVLAGIRQVAVSANWETTLIPVADFSFSQHRKWSFDGIVGRIGRSLATKVKKRNIPTVNVWLNTDATGLTGVYPDWHQAGQMATQHLLSLGFRRLAYVGFSNDRGVEMQLAGYESLAHDIAIEHSVNRINRSYSQSISSWQSFSNQLDKLVGRLEPRTGVCVSDDFLGRFIIERCEQHGLQVPRDVAIVSIENEPLVCEYTNPQLSSIDVGYQQVGMRAAGLLAQLMSGALPPEEPTFLPPRTIVKRQSTDAFGVSDAEVAKCLHFIVTHAHRHISVDDVAAHASLSRRTLERRFKDAVGRTVGEEITCARLEIAKRQLLEPELPVKMVARRSGFRDSSQLCAVFQRELGMSPGQFRKAHAVASDT
ncbi:Xylose operon regulatory protein [Planctomycetes bacterium CA13]|uniref:Xylose operon regulatory protein n=1 Tax=Novipirellula herctigrandis TaxID=2527986 RepID=A0A5C5ZAD7_9BACT|nr:Xylose operon regulatory protein [Planctomycetes bacterium CA13]